MEIRNAHGNTSTKILNELLKYIEFQVGDRIPGKSYRERGNSERIDNYHLEISIIIPIYQSLHRSVKEKSLSVMDFENMTFPYNEKILELLKPWSLCVDLDAAHRVDILNKDQINEILRLLSETERIMAIIHTNKSQFVIAENHFQRALSCARKYNEEGETKTTLLLKVLESYSILQMTQSNFADAKILAEEAYNCVAVAYDPVHPQVQEAAGVLIDCLIHKGDLYDAERFAQVTLDSLKDPANKEDQESEAVAKGYYNMGRVINDQNKDLMRAEVLARESLRIRTQIYANDHYVGFSSTLLADILRKQGNLGDEVKELYERSLAIDVKNGGPDGVNTAIGNTDLGHFHQQLSGTCLSTEQTKEHLQLSKSYYTEALRIYTKIFGPAHQDTIKAASDLSDTLICCQRHK
jgi:tetratricopeptide (TPR) repeat protein